MKKYKRLYTIHFFFRGQGLTIGMQLSRGNNAKEALERFRKKFPSPKRYCFIVERYHGNEHILISNAV